MKNSTKIKLLSSMLAGTIMLSACGEKSDCDIPTRHVHRYTKEITEDISLEEYIDSEKLNVHGFTWNDDYIEVNKYDEELYKLLNSKYLFNGSDNFDYLYNVMSNQHDYLMFYYEYDTIETYTTTDADGHVHTHTRTVHHDGWHRNPNDSDNTGKVRLYHHRYYGYRVVNKNGKFVLERSPYVDDVREIIDDYPYFGEKCIHEVYEEFKFSRRELKNLNPEDFDTFKGPDLSTKSLVLK